MGELTASLSLAERWTTTEICRQLNSVPDEFPDHKCPTSFYKVFFSFQVENIVLVVKTEMTRMRERESIKPLNF